MSKTIGYAVFEGCDEYEQGLGLRYGDVLPKGGVLDWRDDKRVTLFRSRSSARKAITRTHHYAQAFENTQLPERRFCKVVPVQWEPADA